MSLKRVVLGSVLSLCQEATKCFLYFSTKFLLTDMFTGLMGDYRSVVALICLFYIIFDYIIS